MQSSRTDARQHGFRLLIAAVLIFSALLKAHDITNQSDVAKVFSPIDVATISLELILACFLVNGWYPRFCGVAVIFTFAAFAGTSLARAIRGEPSCGCFGKLTINPWFTVTLDAAVLFLAIFLPPRKNRQVLANIEMQGTIIQGPKTRPTQARHIRVTLLLSAAAVLAGGFWYDSDLRKPETSGLSVAPGQLDFGEVWRQDKFPWEFVVRNETELPIEITGFDSSCDCVTVEPSALSIPGRQEARLRLTLDLARGKLPATCGEPAESFSVILKPVVPGSTSYESGWKINGRIKSPLAIVPSVVDFGGRPIFSAKSAPSQMVKWSAVFH